MALSVEIGICDYSCYFEFSVLRCWPLNRTLYLRVKMNNYIYLAIAITSEVIATSALKASDGFEKIIPSAIVVVGYGIAFYCLSVVLKTIPVGIAYAIWSGMGIVLISLVGLIYYGQKLDFPALIGLSLIILGVLVINVFSKSVGH